MIKQEKERFEKFMKEKCAGSLSSYYPLISNGKERNYIRMPSKVKEQKWE